MGDWDLYCALCATETSGSSDGSVGSTNPAMLAIRRSVILELKKQVGRGEVTFPDPTFEDNGEDLDESEVDWDWDDESCAYDPALVSRESTQWQDRICCLGLNTETGRGYFSGSAGHEDHGRVVLIGGEDPDEPPHHATTDHHTYWSIEDGESVVFPMHVACVPILYKALVTYGAAHVSKTALYEAMCLLSTMFRAQLTVDYGNIRGNGTDWECIPGEEYVLAQPEFSAQAKAAIRDKITNGSLRRRELLPDMSERNLSDPFSSLPNEVLCNIASHLRFADLKAAFMASWPVLNATRGNIFWKAALYREAEWSGFGLDLDDILNGLTQEDVDYKGLWLWIEKVTRPVYAVDPPWLGAANRRRVWKACEQIAAVYGERARLRVKKVE